MDDNRVYTMSELQAEDPALAAQVRSIMRNEDREGIAKAAADAERYTRAALRRMASQQQQQEQRTLDEMVAEQGESDPDGVQWR